MGGIVNTVFCIIATFVLSEARSIKPNVDVFEIHGSKLLNRLNIQPVKLQYEIDDKDSKLEELIASQKKNKINDLIQKLQGIKDREEKKQKDPIILILTANSNILNDFVQNSADNYEFDYTRAFYPRTAKGAFKMFPLAPVKKKQSYPVVLRSAYVPEDRTAAPRHRYVYDRK